MEKKLSNGEAALKEAATNPTFLTAIAFICSHITPLNVEMYSDNPYRNAYYCGQRSVGLTIRTLLGKENCIKLDSIKLDRG